MRTTLDLDDKLLMQARQLAAREHTSLSRLIEEGLAARIRSASKAGSTRSPVHLPVFAGQGGLHPSIQNARSQRAILDALDELDDPQ